jgi:hypothetical protein
MWRVSFYHGGGATVSGTHWPQLFDLVVDVFSKMLNKGVAAGLIKGLFPHIVAEGIISLQWTTPNTTKTATVTYFL